MTVFAETQDSYGSFGYGVKPRYELSHEESTDLTSDLLNDQKDALPTDMPYVCVRIDGTSPYANIARTIEGSIFTKELHDDPERMAADFEPYEEASSFYTVVDVEKSMPLGTLRIIEHGPNGFMTINELLHHVNPGESTSQRFFDYKSFYSHFNNKAKEFGDRGVDINPTSTWEVGTIAVRPEYRRKANPSEDQKIVSSIVSGLLYRALYAGAVNKGIEGFLSMIDPEALSTLRGLGIPFDNIPGTRSLIFEDGSEFLPCHAVVRDFDERMREFARQKVENATTDIDRNKAYKKQDMIDILLTGKDLDGFFASDALNW